MQTLEDLVRNIYQFVDDNCSVLSPTWGLTLSVPEKGFPVFHTVRRSRLLLQSAEEIVYGDDIGTAAERQ